MRNYTLEIVFAGFRTLFTSTKTGIADPSVRHGGLQRHHGRQRSFYIFEYGTWDEEDGYWAVDEEDDDQEGFLDINNDVFWTFNQETDDWEQANVAGHRRFKAGKGKGKRRYKKKYRGKFRPFKRSGKAHFAENEYEAEDSQWDTASHQTGWHDSYYGKGKSQGKGGKGKKAGKGFQPSGDKGQEKGSFKASGKRKHGKGKKGKAHLSAEAEDGAPTATAANSTSWNDQSEELYQEYWDSNGQICWYTEDGETWNKWAVPGNSTFIVTEHETPETKNETSYSLLSGLGHWQKIDTNKHATFAILDSGCTRSMGSRIRVTAFVKACRLSG